MVPNSGSHETKVPTPALWSDTFDKSRKASLVWSTLAIAAELAQSPDHKIKSSIIGADGSLPVSLVSLICVILASFYLYAFAFEAARIKRWQSEYAAKHTGVTLEQKIIELYSAISDQSLATVYANRAVEGFPERMIEAAKSAQEYTKSYIDNYLTATQELRNITIEVSHKNISSEKAYELIEPVINRLPTNYILPGHDYDHLVTGLKDFSQQISREVEPARSLNDKLDTVTKQLSTLTSDISLSEQRHFRWYEIGAPFTAFIASLIFWAASTIWPNIPGNIQRWF